MSEHHGVGYTPTVDLARDTAEEQRQTRAGQLILTRGVRLRIEVEAAGDRILLRFRQLLHVLVCIGDLLIGRNALVFHPGSPLCFGA